MSFTATNSFTASSYEILAVGHPAESKTNSTVAEQDYASIYTIPANYITDNKVIRATVTFQYTTGTSAVTHLHYIEIGGIKVYTSANGANHADGTTRSGSMQFTLHGTAAPGASVNVEMGTVGFPFYTGAQLVNTITQPVALVTNTTNTVVIGVQYSGTGSTETMVLRTFLVEALN